MKSVKESRDEYEKIRDKLADYILPANIMITRKEYILKKNLREIEKYKFDMVCYGTGIVHQGIRKWYNPLRLIYGTNYIKHIKLSDFYYETQKGEL